MKPKITNRTFKIVIIVILLLNSSLLIFSQNNKELILKSPNEAIIVKIAVGEKLQWSVIHKGQQIIEPSGISLQIVDSKILGLKAKVKAAKPITVNNEFKAINYKKSMVKDNYNELKIDFVDDFGLIFRAYNDAVAYRFFTSKKEPMIIKNEEANFNFSSDYRALIPYAWDYRGNDKFCTSFEALYSETNISKFATDSLAFLPLMVDVGQNKKVVILEADLEDYPGMYLNLNATGKGFKGVYAPYPLETKLGGYEHLNSIPTKRADYIAKTNGIRNFPWRAIAISESDKELLNNDIVQKLASPSRIEDVSWIIPGQVSWDWWNNWNLSHVDFKAGINTETYKYYIDFASANHAKYIILDDGWSERMDLTKINPAVDLQAIVDYGKSKNVGVVIWASWNAIMQQMNVVFPIYAKMGIRGFKIDFFDRDDQLAVASTYAIAKKAAEYKLLVDYHGIYKPTGLQRTYPNVIGYEGVRGLETMKWAREDAPKYAVSIPFIRMMAGPMDYTPGAMRNANKENFRPIGANPMSQGTRCHQIAMYVVYEAPFQMLSDNPNIYTNEQECTDFITQIPTTFDETVALDGKVGEFVALARKKGEIWFVGAMGNWDSREIIIDFSFIGEGDYQAIIFNDGVNADHDATDYKKGEIKVTSSTKFPIKLAPGGGWAARIEKK